MLKNDLSSYSVAVPFLLFADVLDASETLFQQYMLRIFESNVHKEIDDVFYPHFRRICEYVIIIIR